MLSVLRSGVQDDVPAGGAVSAGGGAGGGAGGHLGTELRLTGTGVLRLPTADIELARRLVHTLLPVDPILV